MADEMQPEEKPQSLGAETYKKLWPHAIWPSDIPAHIPLALNVKMASVHASSPDDNGRSVTKNDFQFPQEANLFTGGTFGDHMSFLGKVTWAENQDGTSPTELECVHLQEGSFIGPKHLINFKIGKFAPDLADGFHQMWLCSYQIKGVPDGTYTLKVWHPTLKPAQKSVVVKGATEASFAIAK